MIFYIKNKITGTWWGINFYVPIKCASFITDIYVFLIEENSSKSIVTSPYKNEDTTTITHPIKDIIK